MDQQYWATKSANDVAKAIVGRQEEQRRQALTQGRAMLWQRSHNEYYRAVNFKGRMFRSGPQAEYLNIYVNHFRNILQHLIVNVTSKRPDLKPIATNTDHRSAAQTIVSRGVLDYYDRVKGLSEAVTSCIENLVVYGIGAFGLFWDPSIGNDYAAGAPGGPTVKDGDVVVRVYSPTQLLYDYSTIDEKDRTWICTSDFVPKWDLIAKYPHLEEKILNASVSSDETRYVSMLNSPPIESDLVPLRRFFHNKTPAVPGGRYVEFVGDDIVTTDSPLPYESIPIFVASASQVKGTSIGHTVAFDMLPIQEWVNKLYSVIATNQANFGVQNILSKRGSGVTVAQISGGLNLVQFDGDVPPSPLNLLSTPPEIFNTIQALIKDMETISGVNSVVRGNPESSLKSGTALSLVASQAVQFNSGIERAFVNLWEFIGTTLINIIKKYATTKRVALISGKSNRNYIQEFSASDLDTIDRVTVELGNPMARTLAGRVQLADSLMQKGMFKVPEEYLNLVSTGRFDPLLESDQAELMLVRSENERLQDGEMVMAIKSDDHQLHIKEHRVVVASPEAREVPQVVQATLSHIDQHLALLRLTDPGLNMIDKQPVLPPPPMPMPPMGTGPVGPGPGVPANVSQISGARPPMDPVQAKNPMTGLPPALGPK